MAEFVKPQFQFDILRMYLGDDFQINSKITVHQPSIQEIADWGERRYFQMVNTLCAIPSDMKSMLYDVGIDWEEITDFEFFIMLTRHYPQSETSILFGDLDLSKMKICQNTENQQMVLYDVDNDIQIDMYCYQYMIEYIRRMHNITPSVEHAYNKRTKLALIEFERSQIAERNKNAPSSILQPMISALVNSSGFKYKINELRELKIMQFMDAVQRVQIIMSTEALMHGMYSGMVDTKHIDKKEFNWLREIVPNNVSGENLRIPNQSNK